MQERGCSSALRNCQRQGRTSFPISQLWSCVTTTASPAAAGGFPPCRCSSPPPTPRLRGHGLGHPIKQPRIYEAPSPKSTGKGKYRGCKTSWKWCGKLSPGFVHGLYIGGIFILRLPTKFTLETTSESLITPQPGDFLATPCSRCSCADSGGGGGKTPLKELLYRSVDHGVSAYQKRLVCCRFFRGGGFNGCLILCATSAEPPQCAWPAKPHKYSQANYPWPHAAAQMDH